MLPGKDSITGRDLRNKRNFRKKILGMGLLINTGDVEQGVAHRAARLYRFDEATLIVDACRAVNLQFGDEDRAIKEMRQAGVRLVTTKEILGSEQA